MPVNTEALKTLPSFFRAMPGTQNCVMAPCKMARGLGDWSYGHLVPVGSRYVEGAWYDLFKVMRDDADISLDMKALSYFDPEIQRKADIAKLLKFAKTYDEWMAMKQAIKEGRI